MTDLETFDAISITMINSEPRVRDVDLGTALGFARPTKIRDLITRYSEKLSEFGILPTVGKIHAAAGRPTDEYFLNRRQALFLCAKSETELALEVTAAMVRLFDSALEGPKREIVRAPQNMEEALELALAQHRELKAKAAEIAVLAPKAEVADRIADTEGLHTLSEAGKMLGFGLVTFCARLRRESVIMDNNLPYETHRKAGRFEVKERPYWCAKHGAERLSATTFVTGKGLVWLAERLAPASSARPVANLPLFAKGGR